MASTASTRKRSSPKTRTASASTGSARRKPSPRKPAKGKRVAMSAEDKAAYAKLIEERVAREQAYGRHLPGNDKAR